MKTPTFKLEKFVPIPPPASRSPLKAALSKMEIGDSLFPLTRREVASARAAACKLLMLTTCRAEGESFRLWYVAKKRAPEMVSGSDFASTQPPPKKKQNKD